MKNAVWQRMLFVLAVLLLGSKAQSQNITLHFEEGISHGGQPITSFYSSAGVVFRNAAWVTMAETAFGNYPGEIWFHEGAGFGTEIGMYGGSPNNGFWGFPGTEHPIEISFAVPISFVSVNAYNIGVNGGRLRAFRSDGSLAGTDQFFGTGYGEWGQFNTLAVTGSNITQVLLDQPRFVTNDGVGWDELTFTLLTASLNGNVHLENCSDPIQPLTFVFSPLPEGADLTRMVTLDATGGFHIADIPRRRYKVGVKGEKWLRTVTTIDLSDGDVTNVQLSLRAGDVNNDNFVDIADLLILIDHYNHYNTQSDTASDLTCDGTTDIEDLLVLIQNYNTTGDF